MEKIKGRWGAKTCTLKSNHNLTHRTMGDARFQVKVGEGEFNISTSSHWVLKIPGLKEKHVF